MARSTGRSYAVVGDRAPAGMRTTGSLAQAGPRAARPRPSAGRGPSGSRVGARRASRTSSPRSASGASSTAQPRRPDPRLRLRGAGRSDVEPRVGDAVEQPGAPLHDHDRARRSRCRGRRARARRPGGRRRRARAARRPTSTGACAPARTWGSPPGRARRGPSPRPRVKVVLPGAERPGEHDAGRRRRAARPGAGRAPPWRRVSAPTSSADEGRRGTALATSHRSRSAPARTRAPTRARSRRRWCRLSRPTPRRSARRGRPRRRARPRRRPRPASSPTSTTNWSMATRPTIGWRRAVDRAPRRAVLRRRGMPSA